MKYDFDELVDRRNTGSLKWDIKENELPMWVADMDFKTCPDITGEIIRRAHHGVFGYSITPDEWYDSYIKWWRERHHFEIKSEWLMFSTGVVPTISTVVRKLTTPAEKVLIQTPVYNIFFNSIINNGRRVLESPLVYDRENKSYSVDFDDLEKKLSDPLTTMMILCNPHNPVGKIWDRESLEKIGSLCRKHHVVVVSDEIHCDITDPGKEYIPFASVNTECRDNCIMCIAPTKTFSIAGLQTSAIVVPEEGLRNRVNRAINTDEIAEPNVFASGAAVAAFTYGGQWLDEMREYVYNNKMYVKDFIETELPMLRLTESEATYLLWVNISALNMKSEEFTAYVRETTGLWITEGVEYGECGDDFVRINIACPRARVEDGMNRLKTAVNSILNR